jgi:hypothetical protein
MREIEIDYNPYLPSCEILIDGTKLMNEYSILVPVCKYPLQAWLEKKGSWDGISYQLLSIVRGEQFSILFKGRKIDYDDLQRILKGDSSVEPFLSDMKYENKYDVEEINKSAKLIFETVKRIWESPYPGSGSKNDMKTISYINERLIELDMASSLVRIDDFMQTEARDKIKKSSAFIVIETSSKKLAMEKLEIVFKNTMSRSADSMVIHDMSDDAYYLYAEPSVKRDNSILKIYEDKYGVPYMIGKKVSIVSSICDAMFRILRDKDKRIKEFEDAKNDEEIPDQEYNKLAGCVRWIRRNEKEVEKLSSLIQTVWEG